MARQGFACVHGWLCVFKCMCWRRRAMPVLVCVDGRACVRPLARFCLLLVSFFLYFFGWFVCLLVFFFVCVSNASGTLSAADWSKDEGLDSGKKRNRLHQLAPFRAFCIGKINKESQIKREEQRGEERGEQERESEDG